MSEAPWKPWLESVLRSDNGQCHRLLKSEEDNQNHLLDPGTLARMYDGGQSQTDIN